MKVAAYGGDVCVWAVISASIRDLCTATNKPESNICFLLTVKVLIEVGWVFKSWRCTCLDGPPCYVISCSSTFRLIFDNGSHFYLSFWEIDTISEKTTRLVSNLAVTPGYAQTSPIRCNSNPNPFTTNFQWKKKTVEISSYSPKCFALFMHCRTSSSHNHSKQYQKHHLGEWLLTSTLHLHNYIIFISVIFLWGA